MSTPLNKKNLTLFVLGLAEGQSLTPVQLQKAVFLLQQRMPEGVIARDRYEFVPYNYGPFCSQVYKDAKDLAEQGLASVTKPDDGVQSYAANSHGVKRTQDMLNKMDPSVADRAKSLVSWVRSLSFASLVNAIYEEYPEYKVNSIFKG